MSNFLLLSIFLSLLGVVLMIIYLLDRVNSIGKMRAGQDVEAAAEIHATPADERFEGLGGEALWNALSGVSTPAWSEEKLSAMRKFYEPVLERHVMEVFDLGQLDARQGIQMSAEPDRLVRTAQGQLASWLPPAESRAIYNLGQDCERCEAREFPDMRARVDGIYEGLRSNVGLPPGPGIARMLLPTVELPTLSEGGMSQLPVGEAVDTAPQADTAGGAKPLTH